MSSPTTTGARPPRRCGPTPAAAGSSTRARPSTGCPPSGCSPGTGTCRGWPRRTRTSTASRCSRCRRSTTGSCRGSSRATWGSTTCTGTRARRPTSPWRRSWSGASHTRARAHFTADGKIVDASVRLDQDRRLRRGQRARIGELGRRDGARARREPARPGEPRVEGAAPGRAPAVRRGRPRRDRRAARRERQGAARPEDPGREALGRGDAQGRRARGGRGRRGVPRRRGAPDAVAGRRRRARPAERLGAHGALHGGGVGEAQRDQAPGRQGHPRDPPRARSP